MKELLTRPSGIAAVLAVTSAVTFVAVGLLAGQDHLFVDWSHFDDAAGLTFLGAWANLILAFAVWFQIRSAEAARTDASNRYEGSRRLEHQRAQLEALVAFVGYASNASSLYQDAGNILGPMLTARRAAGAQLDTVAGQLTQAEQPRQAAATALFRVEALCGHESTAYQRAVALWTAVNRQRQAANEIRQWFVAQHHVNGQNKAPDSKRVTRDTRPLRAACIAEARRLGEAIPGI